MQGTASERSELLVARTGAVLVGATSIAASAVLPTVLLNLWWKGFTTRGAVWSVHSGLLSSVLLVALSPAVSGNPTALLPHADFAIFPLRNPGSVSVPLGFLLGWLGSVRDPREPGGADYAQTEISVLTGAHPRSG